MAWSKWDNEITVPFANTGDKTEINIEESPDNTVSYEKGYTNDYEVTTKTNGDLVASKYTISREELNSILYKLSSAIKELQFKNGFSINEGDKGIGYLYSDKTNSISHSINNTYEGGDLNDSLMLSEGYKLVTKIKSSECINFPKNIDCDEALIYSVTNDITPYFYTQYCPKYNFNIYQMFIPIKDSNINIFALKSLKYYIRKVQVRYSEELSTQPNIYPVSVENSTEWEEVSISQDDIKNIELTKNNVTVTGTSSYSSCETLLVTEGNIIKKILKTDIDNKFRSIEDNIGSINNNIETIDNNITLLTDNINSTINQVNTNTENINNNSSNISTINNNIDTINSNINTINSNLSNKSDNGHTHTVDNITGLGDLATKNYIDLATNKVINILPEYKGGTGNTSIEKALSGKLLHLESIFVKPADSINTTISIFSDTDANMRTRGQIHSLYGLNIDVGSGLFCIKGTDIRDYVIPVGFIYIQLRNQSTPDELFGTSGKWQDISSTYAGEFFRAVGGNSGSFGNTQAEGLPNVTGSFNMINKINNVYANGVFNQTSSSVQTDGISGGIAYVGGWGERRIHISLSSGLPIYGASTHVTPYNSAVRIWKKIA